MNDYLTPYLTEILVPVLVSFAISMILCRVLIPVLKKLKVSNTEREELESHQSKSGTPSMGGIVIIVSVVIISAFYIKDYPLILPIALSMLLFGIIGFIDDWLKTVKRKSDGLLAWQKFLLQMIVTTLLFLYLMFFTDVDMTIIVPFTGRIVDIGWLAVPLFYFAVLGTVNGVNFTDGLDGLASSVTIIVAMFFMIVSYYLSGDVEPIACMVIGSLLAFRIFNVHPAKIFMGDTGSLALGGYVAIIAYVLHMPIFILIVGLVYLIEVLSVILQVSYFKLTHGKRLFKMSPIHHHFEICGWSEPRIVCVFTMVTIILCIVGFAGLLY